MSYPDELAKDLSLILIVIMLCTSMLLGTIVLAAGAILVNIGVPEGRNLLRPAALTVVAFALSVALLVHNVYNRDETKEAIGKVRGVFS